MAYLATSFILALVLTPITKKIAFKIGAVDRKEAGTRKEEPGMPRLGGAAIFIAFICPFLIMLSKAGNGIKTELGALLLGSFVVSLVGAYDDIKGAPVWMRLGVEIAAAGLVYLAGIRIAAIPDLHGGTLPIGWIGLPLTILWIVVITNAMNLIDGLDGLAGGTGILILLTILLLNFNTLDSLLLLCILALLGALLGFLFFNFPPASIYMGDSGSLFLGFFLSSFAVLASRGAHNSRIAWITLLAFSLPLLDMLYAVMRRWYRGVPIISRDNDHLHHKLLQKGFSRRQVAILFYAANLTLMLALVILLWSNSKPMLTFIVIFMISLAAFAAIQFLSDLKPKDFVERIMRLFRMFRRRRYHLYLISRFEHAAEKAKAFSEIKIQLDALCKAYDFRMVEINSLATDKAMALFHYKNWENSSKTMKLEFPLVKDGIPKGSVSIQKELDSDGLMCSGELAEAFSKYLTEYL